MEEEEEDLVGLVTVRVGRGVEGMVCWFVEGWGDEYMCACVYVGGDRERKRDSRA